MTRTETVLRIPLVHLCILTGSSDIVSIRAQCDNKAESMKSARGQQSAHAGGEERENNRGKNSSPSACLSSISIHLSPELAKSEKNLHVEK